MIWDYNTAVAIDYDGTLLDYATNELISERVLDCIELQKMGLKTVLWTNRHDDALTDAVDKLAEYGFVPDYVNEYPLRESSPKINVDYYIDDKANTGLDWAGTINRIKANPNVNSVKEF